MFIIVFLFFSCSVIHIQIEWILSYHLSYLIIITEYNILYMLFFFIFQNMPGCRDAVETYVRKRQSITFATGYLSLIVMTIQMLIWISKLLRGLMEKVRTRYITRTMGMCCSARTWVMFWLCVLVCLGPGCVYVRVWFCGCVLCLCMCVFVFGVLYYVCACRGYVWLSLWWIFCVIWLFGRLLVAGWHWLFICVLWSLYSAILT